MSEKRNVAVSALKSIRNYGDYDGFRDNFDMASQVATYSHSGSTMDILFAPSTASRRLAVFFNSQQKPGAVRLFTWQSASRGFLANRLFISDPTVYFHDALNLAWYAGNRQLNVQQHISGLIAYMVERTGAEELVFFGSSGGGFPALLHSQLFANSLAFVMAPTTTIRNHGNQNLVDRWLEYGYGLSSGQFGALPSDLVLDIPEITNGTLSSPVLLLQNSTDTDFMATQTAPLARALGGRFDAKSLSLDNLHIAIEDYGEGHVMAPSARVSRLAGAISDIRRGGFRSANYPELIERTR